MVEGRSEDDEGGSEDDQVERGKVSAYGSDCGIAPDNESEPGLHATIRQDR